jgi:hypothetical protein
VGEGDHVPDQLERRIRFGCGSVVGAVLGFVWALWELEEIRLSLAIGAGTALLSGVLATRYGDRFWYWLRWFF